MRKPLASALLFVGTSSLAGPAVAGGFTTARFGGEHGNPTSENPTSIYYNPGAIAASDGITIMGDVNLALRWASFEHQQNLGAGDLDEPPDGIGANYGEATLFNVRAAPFLGGTVSIPISDGFAITPGLAFFIPFGGSSSWDKNESFVDHPAHPGAYDGVQRWYAITGQIQTIYLSAAIAVRLADIVHVGVSGGLALSSINTIRARTAAGDNSMGDREGRAWLDASAWDAQIGGGVLITPFVEDRDRLRIGLSYQAPPGIMDLDLEGKLVKHLGREVVGDQPGEEVTVHQNYPDVWRLGASFRPINELELRLFGDWQRWSLFSEQCIANVGEPCEISGNIDGPQLNDDGTPHPDRYGAPAPGSNPQVNLPRNWNDSFGVRFGISYWVMPDIEIFGGIGYDSNAIPDKNMDAALTDFHDVSVAGGAKIRFVEQLSAALSYTHLFYVPNDTTNENVNAFYAGPSNGPDAGGRYTQTVGVINLNLIANFDPFAKAEAEEETPK